MNDASYSVCFFFTNTILFLTLKPYLFLLRQFTFPKRIVIFLYVQKRNVFTVPAGLLSCQQCCTITGTTSGSNVTTILLNLKIIYFCWSYGR